MYRRGFWTRTLEGLRYGGGIGQWSWQIHRLTGVGILLFLVVHIIDTFLVVAYPETYDHTVGIYGGMLTALPWEGVNGYYWGLRWAFRLGELGLIACVLFHSINGLRVAMFDLWPRTVRYQRQVFVGVLVIFFLVMGFVTVLVCQPLMSAPKHWKMPGPAPAAPAGEIVTAPRAGPMAQR